MSHLEFKAWPKTARDSGIQCVITEKIDGTNACIVVREGAVIAAQSRKRFVEPGNDNMGNDNMGFAAWVYANAAVLARCLGDGHHYGEWAGPGIQKNPHNLDRKTLLLFNTQRLFYADRGNLPVGRVPVLYEGVFTSDVVEGTMSDLKTRAAAQGYTPEGIITYFPLFDHRLKTTFEFSRGKWDHA